MIRKGIDHQPGHDDDNDEDDDDVMIMILIMIMIMIKIMIMGMMHGASEDNFLVSCIELTW